MHLHFVFHEETSTLRQKDIYTLADEESIQNWKRHFSAPWPPTRLSNHTYQITLQEIVDIKNKAPNDKDICIAHYPERCRELYLAASQPHTRTQMQGSTGDAFLRVTCDMAQQAIDLSKQSYHPGITKVAYFYRDNYHVTDYEPDCIDAYALDVLTPNGEEEALWINSLFWFPWRFDVKVRRVFLYQKSIGNMELSSYPEAGIRKERSGAYSYHWKQTEFVYGLMPV